MFQASRRDYSGPINPDRIPKDGEAKIVIYGYIPSEALAIAAIALFAVLLIAHVYHLVKWRTTRLFQSLLAFGCLMELIGYSSRLKSHFAPFVINTFIIAYVFVVCAPIFFSAAIYLGLSSILKRMDRSLFPMSPRALVGCFVAADVVTIVAQVGGASLSGVSQSQKAQGKTPKIAPESANNILLAGLVVQNAAFFGFLMLLGMFIFRLRKVTAAAKPPKMLLVALVGSAALVFLRTLYRLAETAEGLFGPLMNSETGFAILEFVPVVLALALWAVYPLGFGLKVMEAKVGEEKTHEQASDSKV